ncbi:MAG: DUF4340 domain-containing protein [Oscillospiraceae bacterium]|nr:DUF4340 domain-containing protein [Oscillospiraceae bacterium]
MKTALIAGLAVLLVLSAGIVLLLTLAPEAAEPEPSPTPAETVELIRESADNVTGVTFTPKSGRQFGIQYADSAYTLSFPGALFPGNVTLLRAAFNHAINLPGVTVVTENADDDQLALFGLTSPETRWRLQYADGTSAEFLIGVRSATGTGRYACRSGERTVFLLTSAQSESLTQSAEDYYDLTFLKVPGVTEESPAWSQITAFVLEKSGETYEVMRRTDLEIEGMPIETSRYHLTSPREAECNDYNIENILMTPAADIAPSGIVEENPADLSVYGLDEPARLTLTGADGWTGTILIGDFDSERAGRYVMMEGIPCVLLDTAGSYAFLDAGYADLRTSQIWIYDITEVSGVTFELDGTTRELTFEHHEDATLRGFLDGTEMTGADETGETNARRLYVAALRVMHDGGTDAEIPSGEPEYRLTMSFVDGRDKDVVELYPLGARQYLIVRNGENLGLYITWTSLREKLLNRFALLDEGKDLPRL